MLYVYCAIRRMLSFKETVQMDEGGAEQGSRHQDSSPLSLVVIIM